MFDRTGCAQHGENSHQTEGLFAVFLILYFISNSSYHRVIVLTAATLGTDCQSVASQHHQHVKLSLGHDVIVLTAATLGMDCQSVASQHHLHVNLWLVTIIYMSVCD